MRTKRYEYQTEIITWSANSGLVTNDYIAQWRKTMISWVYRDNRRVNVDDAGATKVTDLKVADDVYCNIM